MNNYIETINGINVYNSSFSSRENLVRQSDTICSAKFNNIEPIFHSNRTTLKLVGINKYFDITLDAPIYERGLYTLNLDIESDIQNQLGTIKGFQIIKDGSIVVAHLYKLLDNYYYNNVSFSLTPDGNWIKCTCALNLDGNIETPLKIRMLTTDNTSYYDYFSAAKVNSIDVRNFHLYKNGITEENYISTKSRQIISGDKTPSIIFGNSADGYTIRTNQFNVENKAIFCVCSGNSNIIVGPDFNLSTTQFRVNKNTTPVNLDIASTDRKIKLITAYHLDSDIFFSEKAIGQSEVSDSDFAVNAAPSVGNQLYTLFANNSKFKLYDFFVLDDPTNEEITATRNYLIAKYQLG